MNKTIDYIIISSDDNPTYKDLYHIVAKRWYDMGFKTYYINITNEESLKTNKYGVVHSIKALPDYSTAFQSQIVRIFANKFIDGVTLISDIDMLPISKTYFESNTNFLTDDNIIIYSGQPYVDVPYFPMCYILAPTTKLKKIFNLDILSYKEFCLDVMESVGVKWNSDEHYLYNKLNECKDDLIIKDRVFNNRIDRSNWNYDIDLLKNGYYLDSHLLRPLSIHNTEIMRLINDI